MLGSLQDMLQSGARIWKQAILGVEAHVRLEDTLMAQIAGEVIGARHF